MNLAHPASEHFAKVLDEACGRMTAAGLERETMYWLADELACMLSHDRFKDKPTVPLAKELYRLTVLIALQINGDCDLSANPASLSPAVLMSHHPAFIGPN